MAFTFHLQSCLPVAMRTLILHTKPNIRNVSNMAGVSFSSGGKVSPDDIAFESGFDSDQVPPGAPSPWSLPTTTQTLKALKGPVRKTASKVVPDPRPSMISRPERLF
uniref:Uncharacterized protein n=1 Tax=Canis lupus familiaris TaxID=9615 RepID=A0A8C0Q4R3_CANLF